MVKLVDCTIRDGGHQNNWSFSNECLKDSYLAALATGVDYFEIGYRNKDKGVSDKCLTSLMEYDPRCKLTVMTDVSKSDIKAFDDASKSPIKAVRVAAYPQEMQEAFLLLEKLRAKGYEVFLVLMTAPRLEAGHFELLKNWQNKDILEGAVIADSFGSAYPKDIEKIFKNLTTSGFLKIGVHTHNNLQLAFSNALKALELGAAFVDGTIYGIGRGSGGVPMELLCAHFGKNIEPYLHVIKKHYVEEYSKNPWGYSLDSLVGGLYDMHPNESEKELLKCLS